MADGRHTVRMRLTTGIAALTLAAGLFAAAGCSDPAADEQSGARPPSVTVGQAEPAWSPTAAPSGYLADLAAIDPGLVVDADRALRRGQRVCERIAQQQTEAQVVEYARLEFDGGNASVDTAKARRIVAVVRQHLCQ